MYNEPEVWHALLDKLAECFAGYVAAQARAGRRRRPAVRLVGRRPLAGRLRRVRGAVVGPDPGRRPACRRSTSAPATATLLPALARAGGDVIGLDWRIPLDEGWDLVARPRRAGEPRPRRAARPVGPRRTRPRATSFAAQTAGRAHLQPRPRRAPGHRSGQADASSPSSSRRYLQRCDGRTDRRRSRLADVPRLPEGAAHAEGPLRRARPARRARGLGAARRLAHVEPGEAVGLVGRNGSGKSTLLRLVSGIIKPTSGRIEAGGRVASLLELGAGFHPDFTGRENVYLNGSIHGLSRARVREVMDEIVAFAELEQFIDLPVRTYSSGMYMRLGFSVAAHIQADVLLLDEVFAVGDEQFQRKCFGKIAEFKSRGGHDRLRLARRAGRRAPLRPRRAAAAGRGRVRRADAARRSPSTGGCSPATRARRSSTPACASGARGEARIVSAELLDADGDERSQFAAGEPLTVARRRRGRAGVAAAARLARAARRRRPRARRRPTCDRGARLGRRGGRARAALPGRPAAACRRPLPPPRRAARTPPAAARCTRSTTRSGSSSSRPAPTTGAVLLDGDWTMQEIGPAAPIGRA